MTYIQYPPETFVTIAATGERGEAFEQTLGFITVFMEGEDHSRVYQLEEVIFE